MGASELILALFTSLFQAVVCDLSIPTPDRGRRNCGLRRLAGAAIRSLALRLKSWAWSLVFPICHSMERRS